MAQKFRGWNSLDALRANANNPLYGNALGTMAKQQAASATPPKKGEERYGFVKFGEGPSFSSPSHQRQFGTTLGAGLWSAGINPDDPQAEQKARAMLDHLLNSGNKNYQTGVWGDTLWGRDDAKMPGVRQILAKDPNTSAKALLDYAYRAPQMQNALKPNDIGEQIGMTLGEIVVGLIPVVGPYASAAMAAAYSGANGGSLLDAALAGLSGYGAGSLGASIGSGISAAGGVGNYIGQIPGKIGGAITDAGNYLSGAGRGAVDLLSGNGTLTNLNSGGLFPSWVEKGAAAGLPGAVKGAGALLPGTTPPSSVPGSGLSGVGGDKGMSWLTDTINFGKDLGITGGDLLRAGGDLLSGWLNTNAIKDATKAQTSAITDAANINAQGTKDQLALLEKMFGVQTALQEPFRQAGVAGTNRMLDLLGLSANKGAKGYGSLAKNFTAKDFKTDPGYQFRLSEGLKALDQQAAARGGLISSNALRNAQGYGQGMASDEYQRAYDRFNTNRAAILNPLQSLAGMGQTTANTLGTAASNYGANAGNVIGQGAATQGNLMVNAGDVRASGYLGNQNSWNSAITNALSRPGQSADSAMMRQIMARMAGGGASDTSNSWLNYGLG